MPDPNAHRFAVGSELRVETLDWPTVYSLCRKLVETVSHDGFAPDLIIGIYDPGAAGGYPVAAQLASLMQELPNEPSIPIGVIRIEGRSAERGVSKLPLIRAGVARILLVDDVAWSGSTFRIANRALEAVTNATVRSCALLAGRQAIDEGHVDYYGREAVARDALFPWGLVTPTGEIRQFFDLAFESNREVSWAPRPWGFWEQFALNEPCTVRILTIFPGEYLSLQYHRHRDEFFIALDDGVVLQIGEKKLTARQGDYILIPRGTVHRQFAPPDRTVRVLEISFGTYDQVGDIVRLEDKYGRLGRDGAY